LTLRVGLVSWLLSCSIKVDQREVEGERERAQEAGEFISERERARERERERGRDLITPY
jgi:hypothetical protein